MTGRFCGSCGSPVGPDAAFCGSCGTPVAASQAGPPQAGPYVQPQPQPSAPYAPPQAPYAPPPATAPYGQPAYGAPAPQGAPWGAAPGAPGVTVSGRGALDALLTGDWGGAAKAAGFAVLAMLGLSLVGMLLLAGGELGAREILVLTAGAVCAAVGGDIFVEETESFFDGPEFTSSASFGVLPLTLTFVGLGLLGWLFARSLRGRALTARDVALQGVRTALVFTACFLVLSLLTRYRTDSSDELLGLSGRVGVSVWSSLMGALLFAVAALGLVWLFSRVTVSTLPARLAAIRAQVVAPLAGALAVFGAGLLGVLVALIYGLAQLDERVAQFGVLTLGAGNGALASVLWAAGVPLNADAGVGGELGELTGGGSTGNSIDLFTFTDWSAWFWLAPVALLLVLLTVATVLTIRQNSVEDARREGFRFAGALAVLALVAALLLRVAGGAGGGIDGFGATGDVSATFNPIVAAFALAVWGVLAGLLGPVLATKMSSSLVVGIRNRFGVAAPRPVAPPPPVQQWQQPGVAPQQPYAPPGYPEQPQAYQPQPYPEQQHAAPQPEPQQQPLPPVPPPAPQQPS